MDSFPGKTRRRKEKRMEQMKKRLIIFSAFGSWKHPVGFFYPSIVAGVVLLMVLAQCVCMYGVMCVVNKRYE